MIAAIIAGGSGTRLWPISTPKRPKHLQKLVDDASLLQTTVQRIAPLASDTYVITDRSHADEVRMQLPNLTEERIIEEPDRRGTASCITLALAKIKQHTDRDEPVVFLHADHHITDTEGFLLSVETAAASSSQLDKIALIGVEPQYIATGFGYIHRGEQLNSDFSLPVYEVVNFKEKPDYATAREYVQSGTYLWNMGLFVASLRVFEDNLAQYAPDLYHGMQRLIDSESWEDVYCEFVEQPIDTALIEKTGQVVVIPGTFDWADVGSFRDLHHISEQDEQGNVLHGEAISHEVRNSYIRNHHEQPLMVIGLDNVVVVTTENGTVVCHRDYAQEIGSQIKQWQRNSN